MKVVLDANVIIAAYAARGLCESVMEACLGEYEILICDELLEVIRKALQQKIKLPDKLIADIHNFLIDHGKLLEPIELPPDVCSDPDDVKILGLAVAGKADYIVTGDQDLIVLDRPRGIPILNPRSFYRVLQAQDLS